MDRTGFTILDHSPDDGFDLFEEVTAEAWRTLLVESGRLSHLRQCPRGGSELPPEPIPQVSEGVLERKGLDRSRIELLIPPTGLLHPSTVHFRFLIQADDESLGQPGPLGCWKLQEFPFNLFRRRVRAPR